MKLTKGQLKEILKEEIKEAFKTGLNETFGGYTGALGGGGFSYNLGATAGRRPPTMDDPDSIIQVTARDWFMELGLTDKVSKILAQNIASSDLVMVMNLVKKIDTAQEGEGQLYEEDS
jgi:hypothetical protein